MDVDKSTPANLGGGPTADEGSGGRLWITARTLPPADPGYSRDADPNGGEFSAEEQAALTHCGARIGFDHAPGTAGRWVDAWHDPRDGANYAVGYIDPSTLTGALAKRMVLGGHTPDVSMTHATITTADGRHVKVPLETSVTDRGDRPGTRILSTWPERESGAAGYKPTGETEPTPPATADQTPAAAATTTTTTNPPMSDLPPAAAPPQDAPAVDAAPPGAASPPPAAEGAPPAADDKVGTVPMSKHMQVVSTMRTMQERLAKTQAAGLDIIKDRDAMAAQLEEARKAGARAAELEKQVAELSKRPAGSMPAAGSPAADAAFAMQEFLETGLDAKLPEDERSSLYALANMLGGGLAPKIRQASWRHAQRHARVLEQNNALLLKQQALRDTDAAVASARATLGNPGPFGAYGAAAAQETPYSGARKRRAVAPPPERQYDTGTEGRWLPPAGGMAAGAPEIFAHLAGEASRHTDNPELVERRFVDSVTTARANGGNMLDMSARDPTAVARARALFDA